MCKCRDNLWGNDFCHSCRNPWTRSFSAKAVASHSALPAAKAKPLGTKEGTAWSTPNKPGKGKPAPAAGNKPRLSGPKHFRISASGDEDNGEEDSEGEQGDGVDPVKAGIEACVSIVERLKSLLVLLDGY